MPTYEMPLLIRVMKKPELVETLKRTAGIIFNTGGYIRKLENWGMKELPYKISAHGHAHRQANHFCIFFDTPPKLIDNISEECNRDIDIIKVRIFKQFIPNESKCTLHGEMLPPPYRPSVKKLVEMAKKQNKNKPLFNYNSGLDYYPFTK